MADKELILGVHIPNKELAGKKVLWTWDNNCYEIVHEIWGKYLIRSLDGNSETIQPKDELIIINNL